MELRKGLALLATLCMKATRSILHVEMDAFFSAIEQIEDISLRGQPKKAASRKKGPPLIVYKATMAIVPHRATRTLIRSGGWHDSGDGRHRRPGLNCVRTATGAGHLSGAGKMDGRVAGRVAGGMGGGSTGIIFGPIWAMISWRISMTPSFHWVMCVCMLSAMTTTP